ADPVASDPCVRGERAEHDPGRGSTGRRVPGGRHPRGDDHRDDQPRGRVVPGLAGSSARRAARRAARRVFVTEPIVVAKDLEAVLGGRTIWSGVDFEIAPASFTVVLGPNGVGKSTLLKAMLGLQPLSRGTLQVLGGPASAARSRIGYVPQRGAFDESVRIRGRDVVRLGLDGTRWGVPLPGHARRAERARIDEVVRLVEADRYSDR